MLFISNLLDQDEGEEERRKKKIEEKKKNIRIFFKTLNSIGETSFLCIMLTGVNCKIIKTQKRVWQAL